MKKLISAAIAGSLLAASTANAETRPQPTRFSQPAGKGDSSDIFGGAGAILLGVLALAAVAVGISSATKSNSPNG